MMAGDGSHREGNQTREGRAAVFLDRDGVLTENVFNPATSAYESAHHLADLALCANIVAPLRALTEAGFSLFIVSNQPSYAKGKTTLEAIQSIATETETLLRQQGVTFRATYYCYHHPQGIVPGYSGGCSCRKPEPFFLLQAARDYGIDLARSWMVGDRCSDVECGQRAGCSTVLITHPQSRGYQGYCSPTHAADDLASAAATILSVSLCGGKQWTS